MVGHVTQTPGGQSHHKHQVVSQITHTPSGQSHHKHQVVSHITNTRWSVTSHKHQVVSHITNTRWSVTSHTHTKWSVTSQTPGGRSRHTNTRWSVTSKHQVVSNMTPTPGGQSSHKHHVGRHINQYQRSVLSLNHESTFSHATARNINWSVTSQTETSTGLSHHRKIGGKIPDTSYILLKRGSEMSHYHVIYMYVCKYKGESC